MSPRNTFSGGASAWQSRPKNQEDMDLDITPMIDVTFLLLIFFMVTSTMQESRDLEVPAAKHGVGVDTSEGTTMLIVNGAGDGAPPTIELEDGREISLEELDAVVAESMQSDKTHFVIKASGQVSHGFVQQVTRVVNAQEGATFSIGVRDKPES